MTKTDQIRVMTWRHKLLQRAANGSRNVAAACRHFGVSRKTFYKWKKRQEDGGDTALCDRARTPHRDIRRNIERMFGNLGSQRASALEGAMTMLAGVVRANLNTEFSFTISGRPLPDGSRELVVNVRRVHRFQIPAERQARAPKSAGRSRKAAAKT